VGGTASALSAITYRCEKGDDVITRDELIAALSAQGLNVGVQVRLDCVPLEITGVRLDERTGRIDLTLNEETAFGVLRAFLSRAAAEATGAAGPLDRGYSVIRNARGHFSVLTGQEDRDG
jgi:hypothetical protein